MIVAVLVALLCSVVFFVLGFIVATLYSNRSWAHTLNVVNAYWMQQLSIVSGGMLVPVSPEDDLDDDDELDDPSENEKN